MRKVTISNRSDETWHGQAFGPTEHGAIGIEWPETSVVDDGKRVFIRTAWRSVQGHELSPQLQVEFRGIVEIANIVTRSVRSILERHLQARAVRPAKKRSPAKKGANR